MYFFVILSTDSLCCDVDSSNAPIRWIRKAVYRYNLWTGLYMLEVHERVVFHTIVALFFASACLWSFFFASGFLQGWRNVEAASS